MQFTFKLNKHTLIQLHNVLSGPIPLNETHIKKNYLYAVMCCLQSNRSIQIYDT